MAVPIITPTAPAVSPPSRAQRLETMLAEEDAKAKAPAPPEEKAPAKVEEKAPEGVPDRIKQSFEKLAIREATFRKEQEQVKPYVEALKVFSPVEAAALAKAKASGDPLAVLTAAGFSYADVANRMVDLSAARKAAPEKAEPAETAKAAPEIEELRKELAEMKAWRAEQQKAQVLSRIADAVKDRPMISKLGEQGRVLAYIEDYFNRTGKIPGDSFDESVAVAAEAVEQELMTQAKRFAALGDLTGMSKPLTPPAASSTVPAGTREAPATGAESTGQTTLTNDATTAPRMDGVKKSREDRFKEVLADSTLW